MRDNETMIKQLKTAHLYCSCADCVLVIQCDGLCVYKKAADALEELRNELDKYQHAARIIGEICVDESKCHISAENAIQKIREHVYYSRRTSPPPPKEDAE